MRWLIVLFVSGLAWTSAVPALAQTADHSPESPSEPHLLIETLLTSLGAKKSPVLEGFQFIGLRHITSGAVAAQLSLHPGDRFDSVKLQNDIHTLGRLGWFGSIRVEEIRREAPNSEAFEVPPHVVLLFHFEEQPILSRIEYSGSRLLSAKQIEKLLEEKKLAVPLGNPADPAALQRITETIRTGLAELAHPEATVHVLRELHQNATVSVRFEIADGPHLPVRRVRFDGDPQVSEKVLRAQMQSIAPWKPFAAYRSKNAYSQEAFEQDRQRILTYFQDHGYPGAHISNARVAEFTDRSWKRFPWPRRSTQSGLLVSIPVEAGPFYRFDSIEPSEALQQAVEKQSGKPVFLPATAQSRAYSQKEVDKLRRFYSARLYAGAAKADSTSFQSVIASPIFDTDAHSVHLKLTVSDSPPYVVHRLDFQGLHKFSDRFVRRRIPLREGYAVDDRALETGLTRLARTGYFKPIRKENVHVQLDDARHTADIVIHLEEIGQQRAIFSGGRAQFGSTLGLAYTLFDLLNREELLTAKFDGGPQSLQVVLGIAKEGIFGTRSSLAFSAFNNVLRPRFAHGVQGPFFNSHSEGINVPWTYALTNTDTLGVSYTLSNTTSDNPFGAPSSSTGALPFIDFRTHTSSRALTAAWAHDAGDERLLFSNSASGGLLGGGENMLRSSAEAARLFRDPLFAPTNAWAFRTSLSAAGSYHGDAPLASRFFSGDEFVRGLRSGELGPLAMTPKILPSGFLVPSPSPAGANLITAANAEYRIPLRSGVQAASFFDLGSGWLLPNWLGPTKPTLLSATNGVLHGSTGVELRWTVPGIQVPLRSYYAFNVLRLDRRIPLSDKSFFFARNRFSAFGWGLGSLF